MSKPNKAFILAAGLGTRMRPLTDERPKPMVEINGRSLIYHILDRLRQIQVLDVVVNTHYFADMLRTHLEEYMRDNPQMNITISHEENILDTGGGIAKALLHFEDENFFVIAGDAYWEDSSVPALQVLVDAWDQRKMDVLSWMQSTDSMSLTKGVGDYDIARDGRVKRSLDKSGTHMWTNIRINSARIYIDLPVKNLSVLPTLDHVEKNGRYYAIETDSIWHHISTPEDLARVNDAVKGKE